MIDWLTIVGPCPLGRRLHGDLVQRYDPATGEIRWQSLKPAEQRGSFDSSIYAKSDSQSLWVSGNPAKLFQGHNVWGSQDVQGLAAALWQFVVGLNGGSPGEPVPPGVLVKRIDITESFALPTTGDVRAFIRAAGDSAYLTHRGRGQLTKEGTLYFGRYSRRAVLKLYCKADELQAHPPWKLTDRRVLDWAEGKLRIELTLRAEKLRDMGLGSLAEWSPEKAAEVYSAQLEGLSMTGRVVLSEEAAQRLPPSCVGAYQLWRDGHDLRNIFPRATFYRHRSRLLQHGIDVAARPPADRSNVVPLVRVLEAKPAEVPAWAAGTPAFFEPRGALVA